MIWLTPDGDYLVEGTAAPLSDYAEAVRGPDGGPVRPAKFYLVTPAGEVTQAFSEPFEYSVDDERGLTSIHAVSGNALISYRVVEHLWLDLRVQSEVEVAGLTPVEAGKAPPGLSGVIAAYEQRESVERERRQEEDRRKWRALQEALDRLRAALRGEAGRPEATWEFEPGGWVVRRGDGSVLGRGPAWGYGRDAHRQVEAVMRERLGNDFALAVRLGPGEEWAFYPD
jgi:hypothetical protein